MSKYMVVFLLTLFTVVGLLLRTHNLENLPSEMHRDEVAIGYNAYSVLETSFDEHESGPYPLIFKSFGDYKLPGLIYLVAVSEHFLGLSTLAVRLPNAIAATILIPVSYWFVKSLFSREKYSSKIAVLTSILVALSHWHIFLSRTAYEPIIGLTLHILALTFLLRARIKPIFFYFSLIAYMGAFFTYNLPFLLSVLLVPAALWCFRKEYFLEEKRAHTAVFITLFLACNIGLFSFLGQLTEQKSQATILGNEQVLQLSQTLSDELFIAGVHPQIAKVFTHEYVITGFMFAKNYLSSFNPEYLFFSGGSNAWHSLRNLGIGNIDPAHVALIGIAVTWQLHVAWRTKKVSPGIFFLFLYTVISPSIGALTLDAPNTNRLMDFHYSLVVWAAIGLYWLLHTVKSHPFLPKQGLMGLIAGVFVFFTARFMLFYFFLHTPLMTPEWNIGMQTAFSNLVQTSELRQYESVYINTSGFEKHPPLITGYIHMAFIAKTPPAKFMQTVRWSEGTGLVEAESFDIYHFGTQSRSAWEEESAGNATAYVTRMKQEDIIRSTDIVQVLYEQPFGLSWVLYESANYK